MVWSKNILIQSNDVSTLPNYSPSKVPKNFKHCNNHLNQEKATFFLQKVHDLMNSGIDIWNRILAASLIALFKCPW